MRRPVVLLMLWMAVGPVWAAAPVEPERRNAVVRAVERAGPAIVNISTTRIVRPQVDPFFEFRDKFFDDVFRDFFGRHSRTFVQNSLGSGVVISRDGYILTNAHVVMRATKVRVTLWDKQQFDAKLINVDPEHDLALLKIEPKTTLTVVPIGTSADLMIGETAIAIGNPFGLENSVTTGVISAKNRSIKASGREVFRGLLQTDAAINPGNSGGALLNIKGDLIGVNTAIQAGAEGIGFAIPVDAALRSACDLLDYRVLKRIRIGVQASKAKTGVIITKVEPKTPAAKGGLKVGDQIVSVGGKPVAEEFCFRRLIVEHKPGDTVVFGVRRRGRAVAVKVKLERIPEPSPRGLAKKKLGIDVQDITADLANALGLQEKSGVLISGVEQSGPAGAAGLRRSDALVYVGRARLTTVRGLGPLLKDLKAGSRLPVIIVRNRTLYRAVVTSR